MNEDATTPRVSDGGRLSILRNFGEARPPDLLQRCHQKIPSHSLNMEGHTRTSWLIASRWEASLPPPLD